MHETLAETSITQLNNCKILGKSEGDAYQVQLLELPVKAPIPQWNRVLCDKAPATLYQPRVCQISLHAAK